MTALAVMVMAAIFGVTGTFMAPSVSQLISLLVGFVEGLGVVVLGVAGVMALRERLGI